MVKFNTHLGVEVHVNVYADSQIFNYFKFFDRQYCWLSAKIQNNNWAEARQKQQNKCAPSDDSLRSESSLCALWVPKDPSLLQADSKGSDRHVRRLYYKTHVNLMKEYMEKNKNKKNIDLF